MVFFSSTITALTTRQQLMVNRQAVKRVTQISVIVRSMGTATYVGIGGFDRQDRRLQTVGDSIAIDAPLGSKFIDVSSLFVISDTSDAILEIIGDSYMGW